MKKCLKTIGRAVMFLCLGLVLALAGLSAFFFIAGRDIDAPDISDLLSSEPPIDPSENMMPILLDATNRLTLTSGDKQLLVRYGHKKWDRQIREGEDYFHLTEQEAAERADRILATNAPVFAALDAAVSRPRAQYPAELSPRCPIGASFEDGAFIARWTFETTAVFYGRLASLRARRLRESAHSGEAAEELLRYGEMLACLSYKAEGPTLRLLAGDPCCPVIAEMVEAVVNDDLPDGACARIDAACARWAQLRRAALKRHMHDTLARLHNFMTDDCDHAYETLFPHFEFPFYHESAAANAVARGVTTAIRSFPGYRRYVFQPNRTLAEWAACLREVEPLSFALPYTAEMRARLAALEQAQDKTFHPLRKNGMGAHLLARQGLAVYWRILGQLAFWDESNRAIMAIARYRRKHGSPPPTLEALTPEFLDAVPRDPFDAGRPLGYNAEQGTLHTVGADGKFSGKLPKPGRALRFGFGQKDMIRRIDGSYL